CLCVASPPSPLLLSHPAVWCAVVAPAQRGRSQLCPLPHRRLNGPEGDRHMGTSSFFLPPFFGMWGGGVQQREWERGLGASYSLSMCVCVCVCVCVRSEAHTAEL